MLNNKVNLPYDPRTITIATKHKKLLKVKSVTQDLEFWPKNKYIFRITLW